MSYENLPSQIAAVELAAVKADMEQRGFDYTNGAFHSSDMDSGSVQDAVDSTVRHFASVPGMFSKFLGMPDPDRFEEVATLLSQAASKVSPFSSQISGKVGVTLANPELGKMTDITRLVGDWNGDAAGAFRDFFLLPWQQVTANQSALIVALKSALQAEASIWRNARDNVDQISVKAVTALEGIQHCDPTGVLFIATVLGSVFAVGAAVPAVAEASGLLMKSAPLEMTIAGELSSTLGSVPQSSTDQVDLGGKTADAVVGNVKQALDKVAQQISDAEMKVRDALSSALGAMDNPANVIVPRPELADATRSTIRDQHTGLGTADY